MAQQHQIGSRLVSIEPKLLQAAPESLKVNFAQFFTHIHTTLPRILRVVDRWAAATIAPYESGHPGRRAGNAPRRRYRGQAQTDGRDQRPADPLANHETIRVLRA